MPYYDFHCNTCHRRFEVFLRYAEFDQKKVTCPHCGSEDLTRLIRRVRIGRGNAGNLDNLDDDQMLADLEDDPRKLGQMMRSLSAETGEDLGPQFDEVVDRLERGENPEDIAESLPDEPEGLGDASFD
jgi:putative FmdB family regulatory protein